MFKSLIAIFLSVVFCVCTVGCAASAPVPNPNSTAEVEIVQQETATDSLNSKDSTQTNHTDEMPLPFVILISYLTFATIGSIAIIMAFCLNT